MNKISMLFRAFTLVMVTIILVAAVTAVFDEFGGFVPQHIALTFLALGIACFAWRGFRAETNVEASSKQPGKAQISRYRPQSSTSASARVKASAQTTANAKTISGAPVASGARFLSKLIIQRQLKRPSREDQRRIYDEAIS